jgi:signal transduction histidine kinase
LQVAGVARPLSEFGESVLEGLELNPTQNDLQITYSSSSIGRTSVRYQFMLEGADHDWGSPTDLRTVVYARLTPGRYRFLVRAVNSDGVSKTPATVSFTILPPIWRRWWFIVLASLFVLSAASLIERYRGTRRRERHEAADALRQSREERLRELERVRKRIAGDLHDDIGSSLTKISLLSEVLRRRIDHSDASVQAPLEMIGDSSRDLLDTMSDIVWATNPQKDRLSDLSRRMRSLASDLFTLADINFSFAAPADESDMVLGATLRREVFLIFKESINNIIKHSGATSAQIEFQLDQDRLRLRVSDNGQGFQLSEHREGHGLASMRARSVDIGGLLDLVSAPGKGTSIMLRAPLRDVSSHSEV